MTECNDHLIDLTARNGKDYMAAAIRDELVRHIILCYFDLVESVVF